MSVKLIVFGCMSVLSGYCLVSWLVDLYRLFRPFSEWIAEHDDRALLNRQRQAARDREMRKVEATADRNAQMHAVFADVIHSTTPFCDYLDTPRNAVPYIRPRKRTMQAGEL